MRLLFDVDVDINVDVKVAIQADVCIDIYVDVEVEFYVDVDVGVCLGYDRLSRNPRTVIIPASIVTIIVVLFTLNSHHCHHRAHFHGSQDNDLSLSQATELLRVVTARSQELQLPLVVAILDR